MRSPSVAFGRDGSLHVVAADGWNTWSGWVEAMEAGFVGSGALDAAWAPLPGGVQRVVHLRSDDLGRTWGPANVLHGNGNHPYVATDPATGLLVATIRDFAGDGFERSTVAWSRDDGRAWWGDDAGVSVPCHLPTRAVFADGRAWFVCTDHEAMADGRVLRLFSLDPRDSTAQEEAAVPVLGVENVFSSLAQSSAQRFLLAWTVTAYGGAVAGDVYVASGSVSEGFGEPVKMGAALGTGSANLAWTQVASDPQGRFHLAMLLGRGASAEYHHLVLDPMGAVLADAVLDSFRLPPTGPASDPGNPAGVVQARSWGSYPGIAFGPSGGILAYTENADRQVRVALLVPVAVQPPDSS